MAITERLLRIEVGGGSDEDLALVNAHLGSVTDANRCYLRTEEQQMVSSIRRAFHEDVAAGVAGTAGSLRSVLVPLITDITDDGEVRYDERNDRKLPSPSGPTLTSSQPTAWRRGSIEPRAVRALDERCPAVSGSQAGAPYSRPSGRTELGPRRRGRDAMTLTRVYRNGVLEAEGFPVVDVSSYLAEPDTVVSIDFCAPSRDELHELADEVGLHELAIEDAIEPHQRPKLDHYSTHLFLTCHAVRVDAHSAEFHETEIDAFINERWLITVRKDEGFSMEPVLDRWDQFPDLAARGVSFLLYGLLDLVIDGYFDTVQAFDEYYDEVSEGIFAENPLQPSQQRHWFQMRQALIHFHRLVVPVREAVSGLMRREHAVVHDDLYPYFQDVYDHILRVSESTDALRDLVGTIVETNLSLRDYRTNQIMKKVTSWAAIIAVPTLITGFYGMNVPYPGFARHSGVIMSIVLIIVMSGGLYVVFKAKDWL
jgi:magnesium transporter